MDALTSLSVAPVFIAIFALVQVPMTMSVGIRRVKTKIWLLTGDDEMLTKLARAHGNFTETVPIALLVMTAAELSGAPKMLIWVAGGLLILGRILHYFTILTSVDGIGRATGMLLTMASLVIFGFYVLLHWTGVL